MNEYDKVSNCLMNNSFNILSQFQIFPNIKYFSNFNPKLKVAFLYMLDLYQYNFISFTI